MLFHQTQQMYLGIQCVLCLWMGHIWIKIRTSKLANKQITNLHLTTRSLLLRPWPLLQCWSTYSLVIRLFFKPSSSNSCWLVIQHCFFPWQRLLVWFVLNIWKYEYDRIYIWRDKETTNILNMWPVRQPLNWTFPMHPCPQLIWAPWVGFICLNLVLWSAPAGTSQASFVIPILIL